jgi:TPR repeat protein
MRNLAMYYSDGGMGLPVDQAKCVELLRQSADLCCTDAQFQLGMFYHNGMMGLQQNNDKGLKYNKKAAEGGHLLSRHRLGLQEQGNGDYVAAMRHLRLSASAGLKLSMDKLIDFFFMYGLLCHRDLAETLQAFYLARAEMKSEDRDKFIAHLKRIGEYQAEYDW